MGDDNIHTGNGSGSGVTGAGRDAGDATLTALDGPKIDRRTSLQLLGTAGFAGLAATVSEEATAAERADSDEDAETQPQRGGTIQAGWLTNELDNLDPHLAGTVGPMQLLPNVFNGLLKFNQEGEIVGDIAADWTVPDQTTYRFSLREGVTFQNGEPLTASSVKWSLNRLQGFDRSPHVDKVDTVESIDVPDETTVVVNLDRPTAPFLAFMTVVPGRAGAIVSRTAIEEMGVEAYNRRPVGSGPFRITGRERAESLTLERYEDYWGTRNGNQLPYLDSIRVRLIPEPTTLWTALNTGSIQFASSLPGQFARQAENSRRLQVTGVSPGNWQCVSLLCNNPAEEPYTEWARIASGNEVQGAQRWDGEEVPTANKQVRKAIAHALDREEIVEKGYFGWADPAHSLFNPAIPWLYEEQPEPGQYHDPERARQLLDEAGYTGSPRFSASLLGTPDNERAMTVIQSQLSNVGIEANLEVQQTSSFWTAIYDYTNAMSMYWGAGDVDPWMSIWRQLHTPVEGTNKGVWQKSLWSNEEFDSLIQQSFRTPDREQRKQYLKQAEEIFVEEAPYAMTTFPLLPKPANKRLQGVDVQLGLSDFRAAYLTG